MCCLYTDLFNTLRFVVRIVTRHYRDSQMGECPEIRGKLRGNKGESHPLAVSGDRVTIVQLPRPSMNATVFPGRKKLQ